MESWCRAWWSRTLSWAGLLAEFLAGCSLSFDLGVGTDEKNGAECESNAGENTDSYDDE